MTVTAEQVDPQPIVVTSEHLSESRRIAYLESRRRGLSQYDADEVAQEIGIRLMTVFGKGKVIQSVGAWSRTSTRNYIIDLHRKENRLKSGGKITVSLE